MHRRRVPLLPLALLLALAIPFLLPLSARADGVIIVEPPTCDPACPEPVLIGDQLVIRSHRVDVTVRDQVATTRIDQVFHNPNDWAAEGTYVFPVPEGATIGEFLMWVDGEPVEVPPSDFAADLSRVGDLVFDEWPDSARVDDTNLLLFRSQYRQPFGEFSGTLPNGIELAEGYGVMEAHDVRW